jgi:pheromone shutdown protein TraB
MITLLGTGHIFKIAEPVAFIVKNIWPDAVLVELDPKRYGVLRSSAASPEQSEGNGSDQPWAYRNMAKYQSRMAKEYDSQKGAEFIAAIETGKTIGAAIELIDVDAQEMMNSVWREMPFFERMRFTFSMIADKFRSKKAAESAIENFTENEEEYFRIMRKKYPTLVRKIIDERDLHMAVRIREATTRYQNIVVVIGDGHVEGIASLLEGENIRKIRLKTLMDAELMNALRAELWSGRTEPMDETEETDEEEMYE